MTEPIDENLERRVIRGLDGELDDGEQAALDRDLLRDPAARRLRDETAAADRLAGDALRAAFARGAADGSAQEPAPAGRMPVVRRWVTAAVAAAAAVLLVACAFPGVRALLWGGGSADGGAEPPPRVLGEAPGPAATLRPDLAGLFHEVWTAPMRRGPQTGTRPAGPIDRGPAADTFEPLPAIQGPRRAVRSIDRHFLGVFDEEENKLYLLELDRVRTRIHAVGKDL